MPIYEYQKSSGEGCALCAGTFEVFAKMSDPDLLVCPQCGAPVQRVLSASPGVIGQSHLLQEKNVAKNGFTQYKRAGGGVYEKTAGTGPKYISDDGKSVDPT